MRVTDLEQFALEQIWRPYQSLAGYETRLTSLPMTLDDTARLLSEPSEWSARVIGRLRDIGLTIPAYIQCELADVLRATLGLRP